MEVPIYRNKQTTELQTVYINKELTLEKSKNDVCSNLVFGSLMPGRSFNANSYRFGFNNGSEKDDEITGVTGSHYSTFYRELDTRVVRWWSIDPKTNQTPWESPYASMGNNPIINNDPDGDIIRIYYKEKKGLARLFEKRKHVDYDPNNAPTVDNQFVNDVYKSLDYMVDNKADINDAIVKVVNSSEVVKIVKSSTDSYNPRTNKVNWSRKGMKVWRYDDNSEGRQSAALGLFHEVVHGFIDLFYNDTEKTNLENSDPDYDTKEEKEVIENYETKAAKILGEGTRDNHEGMGKKYSNVTSTKTKRELRKEKKKK